VVRGPAALVVSEWNGDDEPALSVAMVAVKLLTRTGLDWTYNYPAIQAYLDGEDLAARPLIEQGPPRGIAGAGRCAASVYSDHQIGHGPAFHAQACA
jgi:hypothetical protein